jgi:hypothetical protein
VPVTVVEFVYGPSVDSVVNDPLIAYFFFR